MENPAPFDLNEAIRRWQQGLVASPAFSADNLEEMASHLRASAQRLKAAGLSEEEAFLIALRRFGQRVPLEQEFSKADPAKVWRERVFWMAASLVGAYVFMACKDLLASFLDQSTWMECFYLIPLASLILAVAAIRSGKVPPAVNRLEIVPRTSWLSSLALLLMLTATIVAEYARSRSLPSDNLLTAGYNLGLVLSWFGNAWWPVVMVMILLLTAKRTPRTSIAG